MPVIVSLIYQETEGVYYAILGIIMLALGILISRKAPRKKNIYAREGFAIVALSWLLISLLGAIPFCLTGEIPSYVDAVFETVSGFTTTGIFRFLSECGGIKPYKFILAKLLHIGLEEWGFLCL